MTIARHYEESERRVIAEKSFFFCARAKYSARNPHFLLELIISHFMIAHAKIPRRAKDLVRFLIWWVSKTYWLSNYNLRHVSLINA